MKILISGATGFLGSGLVPILRAEGHDVWALSRRPGEKTVVWDPAAESLDPATLDGFDAVVHLAGENIAGRWTEKKKRAIYDSRVKGTRLLAEACAGAVNPPVSFVMASAVGIYGDRGDEVLTEESPAGSGWLVKVVKDWEGAAGAVETHPAVRVVKLRFGIILGSEGGALKQMLLPFKLGLGGRLGSGNQWMSWITRDDVLRLLQRAVTDAGMRGDYNAVAPEAVTNAEFTRVLGHTLHRPAVLQVPRFALKLAFGDMADEALFASARVVPKRLQDEGFEYQHAELRAALDGMLG